VQPGDYGDRLKIGYIKRQKPSFNPMIARTEYDRELNRLIFGDGLYTHAPEKGIVRGLAQLFEREQSRIYRVNLRSNIYFHDGSEIKAEDVKFTFELYKKFAFQSHLLFNMRFVSSVEVRDTKNLRIILKQPLSEIRETIGLLPILPKRHYQHWLNYNLLSSLPDVDPQGNGYFLYRSRSGDNQIHLDVFPAHYIKRANLNGIDVIFYNNYEEMMDAFINGQIDIIKSEGKAALQKIYRLSVAKQFISVQSDDILLYYINLNTRTFPFNDINIRRAFNYAINKEQIVERNLNNEGQVAQNVLVEDSEYFFPSARTYPYDPLRSLNILNSAGFKSKNNGKRFRNDQELKFVFYFREGSSFEENIARLISINLAELGINMIPRPIKPSELDQLIKEGRYQAALRDFVYTDQEPAQSLREFYKGELKSENGFRNFNHVALNTAVSRSENAYTEQQITTIMQQMQVRINQYSPCIFLFFQNRIRIAINDRFKNTNNKTFEKLEYVTKIYPKNEWYVSKQNQKY
jgi:peptide/nickel transport system substrate-binding protein